MIFADRIILAPRIPSTAMTRTANIPGRRMSDDGTDMRGEDRSKHIICGNSSIEDRSGTRHDGYTSAESRTGHCVNLKNTDDTYRGRRDTHK